MMGLISGVLLLPVTGPVFLFRLFLERIRDQAEAMLHDEGRAFAELVELSMRRNAGQLSDEEYARQEIEILDRLRTVRDEREELMHSEYEGDYEMGEDEWLDAEPDESEYWSEESEDDGDQPTT